MNVPTGYTALDLVGFTDKGIYSSGANYVQNDIVHYGGDMWRCLIDDTTNITPSEGLNWTLWIGEPTNLTEAIIAPLEVSPAMAAHSAKDQLIYNDVLYKVIAAISIGDSLTVGTNIEVERKIVYQIDGIKSDIATIEPTATASKNYAVDEYMFYGWEFYRVTTAITAGDTIVTTGAGKNVTEVTVGNELTALKSDVEKVETLVVSTGATVVTSLPYTFSDAAIETDMVCLKAELGTPSSQLSNWTVNTDTAGQAVVSGTMASAGTTIKLYLQKSR